MFRLKRSHWHTDVHSLSIASVTGDIGFVYFLEDYTDFVVTMLIKRNFKVECAITDAVNLSRLGMLFRALRTSTFAPLTETNTSRIMCLNTVPVKA